MIHHVVNLVVVQLFWISLVLIGCALIKYSISAWHLSWARIINRQPIFFQAVVWYLGGFVFFGLLSVPFYVLALPVSTFALIYVTIMLFAGIWLWFQVLRPQIIILKNHKFNAIKKNLFKQKPYIFVLFIGVLLLLAFDYIFSLYVGGQIAEGSDSYVFLAKITNMLATGMSFSDGFIETALESRYHLNAYMAILAVPSYLFEYFMLPADVWRWSFGFARLVQWLAIFSLAYVSSRVWFSFSKTKAQYLGLLAVVIAIATADFMKADFPNQVVNVWIILYICGIALLEHAKTRQGASIALIALSSVAICLTHPTYSLMVSLFTGIFLIARLVSDKFKLLHNRRRFGIYLCAIGILLVAPVLTAYFPQRIGKYGNTDNISTIDVIGTEIITPVVPSNLYKWILGLFTVAGFSYMLFSVRKQRSQLILVLTLLTFFAMTAHNPLFMSVTEEKLPLWLVARFSSMNILSYVATLFGLLCIARIGAIYFGNNRRLQGSFSVLMPCIGALMIFILYAGNTYKYMYHWTRGIEDNYYEFIYRTRESFDGAFPVNATIFANKGDSYFLPAVVPVKVVAVDFGHATPNTHAQARLDCQSQTSQNYNRDNLAYMGVDYVFIARWETDFDQRMQIMKQRPNDFTYFIENPDYVVYKFNRSSINYSNVDQACRDIKTIEDID